MHETIKAKEIEEMVWKKARQQGLKSIDKVIIKIGKGEGESREDIAHIIKEHMNIEDIEIIEEEVVLVCRRCGKVIKEEIKSLNCPECGSIKIDILSGMGVKVIDVR